MHVHVHVLHTTGTMYMFISMLHIHVHVKFIHVLDIAEPFHLPCNIQIIINFVLINTETSGNCIMDIARLYHKFCLHQTGINLHRKKPCACKWGVLNSELYVNRNSVSACTALIEHSSYRKWTCAHMRTAPNNTWGCYPFTMTRQW